MGQAKAQREKSGEILEDGRLLLQDKELDIDFSDPAYWAPFRLLGFSC